MRVPSPTPVSGLLLGLEQPFFIRAFEDEGYKTVGDLRAAGQEEVDGFVKAISMPNDTDKKLLSFVFGPEGSEEQSVLVCLEGKTIEDTSDAKLALARHWRQQEIPTESIPFYLEALKLDPKASIVNELGIVYRQQGMLMEEEALYSQALEAGVWKHRSQRPLQFAPSLRAKAWWDIEEVPAALALEDSYAAIKDELAKLLASEQFAKYTSGAVVAGEWSDYVLFKNGTPLAEHCEACPETVAALHAIPGATTESKGNVYFSCLAPDTHIRSHCGPTNTRLRIHLGLQVPAAPNAPKIRVDTETRAWEEGKCLVFDDSFEHEVWNYAEKRIILIVDMWHPELKTVEQQKDAFATPFYA